MKKATRVTQSIHGQQNAALQALSLEAVARLHFIKEAAVMPDKLQECLRCCFEILDCRERMRSHPLWQIGELDWISELTLIIERGA